MTVLDDPNDWAMDANVDLPDTKHRVTAAKTILNLPPIGRKAFTHAFYSFDDASFIAGTLLQIYIYILHNV